MLETLLQLDRQLFLFINGLHHPLLDPVMVFISGKLSWLPLYVFLLFLIVRQFKWQAVLVMIFVAVLISLSDQASVKAFKFVFERPRPCHEADLQPLIHLAAGRCGGAFGFVSSHAANSFALATFIWLLLRQHFSVQRMAYGTGEVGCDRTLLWLVGQSRHAHCMMGHRIQVHAPYPCA